SSRIFISGKTANKQVLNGDGKKIEYHALVPFCGHVSCTKWQAGRLSSLLSKLSPDKSKASPWRICGDFPRVPFVGRA
ncbi:hypothetical protein ACFLQR_01445, partial [Verrucomicrobiota bacterium]